MKPIRFLPLLAAVLLVGCADDDQRYTAPDIRGIGVAVGDGQEQVKKAVAIANTIEKTGAKPGDQQVHLLQLALSAAEDHLVIAQQEVAEQQAKSDAQIKQVNEQLNQMADELKKANEEIAREKAQAQREDLLLVLAFLGGAGVFWAGSTFGKAPAVAAFPPVAIVPGAVFGLAAVLVVGLILFLLLKFWAAISWLVHLL